MLDTIIITVLGIIVVIQNIYITKSNYKLDMFDELHKYHNELVSITKKYINKEIDIRLTYDELRKMRKIICVEL